MKALVIKSKGNMAIEEVNMPELQSEEEVIVQIHYSGICRSDIELLEGTHPHLVNKNAHYPLIPGHEWSGVVYKVGSKVKDFKVGDRVVGDVSLGCGNCVMCKTGHYNLCPSREVIGSYRNRQGSFAEYLRTHSRGLYKIPDNLSLRDAATVEAAATSAYAVKQSDVKYGDKVLIIGDGPIGLFAIQCAKAFGAAEVSVIGSSKEKMELSKSLGCTHTVSYREGGEVEKLLELTKGELFDCVIETSGKVNGINNGLELLKPVGTLGLVGFYGENLDININKVVVKDVTIRGILASPNMFAPTLPNISNGNIEADKLITHEFDFEDIHKAFETGMNKKIVTVKVMVKISKDN